MSKREDYEVSLSNLMSAKSEDEVIKSLFKIVKGYSVNFYKNDIYSNPYFKSLIIEVKNSVVLEMNEIRRSIVDEIKNIDSEIIKLNTTSKYDDTYDMLKSLKRDCINLIVELDERLNELNSLV